MVLKSAILAVYIIISSFMNPLYASEITVMQHEDVLVQYQITAKNTAREILNLYPNVKDELEKTIGWKLRIRPTIRIVRGLNTSRKMANSNLVVAIAIPRTNTIIIDRSRANVHPFSLESTLKHELCHLMLHQHIRDAILPKWFDEGVSQWISGGIAEIITGEDGKKALKEATLSKKFLRLKDLSRQFPKNAQSFILAYEQSKSIVEYIVREFGKHGLLRVLNNLKQGDEIEIAIQKGLEISFVELERTWQDYLVRRFTWPIYLSNNLYKILFFFAGLITIYGFLRLIWKIKTYKDEDDDTLDTDV